jgi:hypothetical protein
MHTPCKTTDHINSSPPCSASRFSQKSNILRFFDALSRTETLIFEESVKAISRGPSFSLTRVARAFKVRAPMISCNGTPNPNLAES